MSKITKGRTIDVTPTWEALVPLFVTIIRDGQFTGVKEAEAELRRMAKLADLYVASQKEKGE